MTDFTAGDTVSLKSGGPWMTVDSVQTGKPHLVFCVWFEGTERKTGSFRPDSLVADDGAPPAPILGD